MGEGVAVLWVEKPDGSVVAHPADCSMAEQAEQVLALNVSVPDSGIELVLVFRRADFSKLLAHPNNPDFGIETAVSILMEEQHDAGTGSVGPG